ncbi:MAG: hypothetical protein UU24_C0006G0033 [Candidatus Nomurabacteria bacterium GW2011_GWA2_40_9]|uniref:Uncharacterized protein n=1 Tax=Candidatus Nomurabacteria bacterium GW2011_GWA2_40_9 TaxID=1618734 RepID=A0A0G0TRB8_9BACT|nr:MAG: hypothetical protein UU24_C0006G0033 [Candidatus Nomurabacteria bacterium GW2011_GWA2_40_9]
MGETVTRLIFFNLKSEVDEYVKKYGSNNSDYLCIGLNPIVFAYLKKKNLLCSNTLPYFTNDSHAQILRQSDLIITWMRESIQLPHLNNYILYERFCIHYYLWLIEIVVNAIQKYQPKDVCVFSYEWVYVKSLYGQPFEKHLSCIVEKAARIYNLRFEKIILRKESFYFKYYLGYLVSILKFVGRCCQLRIDVFLLSFKQYLSQKKIIFYTTSAYNLESLVGSFQKKYSNCIFKLLKGPVVLLFEMPYFLMRLFWKSNAPDIFKQKIYLEEINSILRTKANLFLYKGISFLDFLIQKNKSDLFQYLLNLSLWDIEIQRLLKRIDPSLIISNGNRDDDILLAELCNLNNVPSVLISHGSHVYPKNESERIEWGEHGMSFLRAPFSHFALQTPLSEGYLDVFPSRSEVIKTGPLIWGFPIQVRQQEERKVKKVKIILHAGTYKYSNCLRPYVYETADEYIQSICDLANAVEKLSDTILIVKFRPGYELNVKTLRYLVPFSKKVVLNIEDTFLDVLAMTDLLISFSSTCIEEALQNKIPVLLYGGGGRYQHVPATEIRPNESTKESAVYFIKEVQILGYGINKILELNSKNDTTFLFDSYIYPKPIRMSLGEHLIW